MVVPVDSDAEYVASIEVDGKVGNGVEEVQVYVEGY